MKRAVTKDLIGKILGKGGILSASISGYEHRGQQITMAREVSKALSGRKRLIVEAPTGTGKTLAYLTAAAISRQRTAISTATKNLQEQLFFKDTPFIREKVFPELKIALVKGRGNYVCHTRYMKFLRQPYIKGLDPDGSAALIQKWYPETCDHGEGDRSELDISDDNPIWPEICSTSETCLGKKCPTRDECFVLQMRVKAAEADLMIINHHLLCSDLAVKEAGYGEVIPKYEALIIDEAHALEDAATQHFGFYISQFKITRFLREARAELDGEKAFAEKYAKSFEMIEGAGRRLFDSFPEIKVGKTRIQRLSPQVKEARDTLIGELQATAAMIGNSPQGSDELKNMSRRGAKLAREVHTILQDNGDADYAVWGERREKRLGLHADLIDTGEALNRTLYPNVGSIVFTSATLSSSANFSYFKSRVAVPAPVTEVILDSPFDYSRQTLLYVPASMPEPSQPTFADSLAPQISEILQRTEGRAFVLFTSYKNMQAVYEALLGQLPFPLLMQGQKPKTRLLEEFQTRPGAVLLATASFWEGIDVQGEALSCVIVDKLPFAPPNDPIIAARVDRLKKQGQESFFSFQTPMAVIALKQGFGRLIRTRSDKGVLCILDVRIVTKAYGKVFRQSLFDCPLTRDLDAIEGFFASDE